MLSLGSRLPRSQAAVLVLACLITYANALGGGFTYDDKAIVRDNPRIRAPASVPRIFATQYFGGPSGSGTVYRPVLLLSYALQWWIHGGQAVAFHAVNVLLHAGVTLLLGALFLRVGIPPGPAFAAAILFAVLPIHVEAVTSLVGRGEILAAVFVLFYLHLALRYYRRFPPPAEPPGHPEELRMTAGGPSFVSRLPVLLAALLCYALAVLTKESGSSAPALAFLLFVFVEEGRLTERLRRAFARGLPLFVGSGLILAGVFLLRRWILGGFLKAPGVGIFEVENALFPLDALSRAVNACVILFRYVGRTFFPLHLSADESAWSIDVVPNRSTLAIGTVLLVTGIAAASVKRLSSRSPLALGFLFFCAALLPTSNLPLAIGTILAERLAYLPSAGLCLAAGALLAGSAAGISDLPPRRRRILAAAVVLFSARAIVRNSVWWTDEGLFLNLVRTSPESAKAHYDIAYVWADARQYLRARAEYERATEIYEDYWDAWAGKCRVEREMGLLSDAEESCEQAIEVNPAYENGYFQLGLVREARGDPAAAEETYRKGLTQKKDSLPLAYRLAMVRSRLPWPEALGDWRRALALGPVTASVHADFAAWLLRAGKADEGVKEARRALAIDAGYLPALRLLADRDARSGFALAEALAREKIFRLSRSPEDWQLLLRASAKSEAYARRFARGRKALAPLVRPAPGRQGQSSGGASREPSRSLSLSVVRRLAARIATRG